MALDVLAMKLWVQCLLSDSVERREAIGAESLHCQEWPWYNGAYDSSFRLLPSVYAGSFNPELFGPGLG
eukprot:1147886-Pelagomonas_calceolata.AAC.4